MYITRGKESEMGNVAAQGNNKTTMTFRQVHDRLGHMSDAATRETLQNNSACESRKHKSFHAPLAPPERPNRRTSSEQKQQNKRLDNDGLTWTLQQSKSDKECPFHQNRIGESLLWINESKSIFPSFSRPRTQWLSQHVNNYTNGSNQTLGLLT